MSAPYITAHDVRPGQTWRHEVTQAHQRHATFVREVTDDGYVRMHGHDELVPIGNLLAYWSLVAS